MNSTGGHGQRPGTREWNEVLNAQFRDLVALAVRKYGDVAAIDVGANFGDTAAIAKLGGDVPVLCIEGDPSVFRVLQQNLAKLPGVTARLALLGEREETVSVVTTKNGWNMTLVPRPAGGERTIEVQLTTLDACVRDLPDADRYRVLKVDAEGYDCRILRGGMDYIARVRPMITFEYNRANMDAIGEPGLDTLWRLRDAGYHALVYLDLNGRLLLATTLDDEPLIRDLHDYADGREDRLEYVDLCAFHADDADLAAEFVRTARARRSHAA